MKLLKWPRVDSGIRRCTACGLLDHKDCAETRVFNTGRCAECNGELEILFVRELPSLAEWRASDDIVRN